MQTKNKLAMQERPSAGPSTLTAQRSHSSRQDFIDSSRKILFTNISILEKKREAETIRADSLADASRVRDARWHFELDTDRYENFQRDQETARLKYKDAIKMARAEREALEDQMGRLRDQITQVQEVARRVDKEQMAPMRRNQAFLQTVALAFEELYSRQPTRQPVPMDEVREESGNTFITENRHKLTLLKSKMG